MGEHYAQENLADLIWIACAYCLKYHSVHYCRWCRVTGTRIRVVGSVSDFRLGESLNPEITSSGKLLVSIKTEFAGRSFLRRCTDGFSSTVKTDDGN